jgi:hypothetical protein
MYTVQYLIRYKVFSGVWTVKDLSGEEDTKDINEYPHRIGNVNVRKGSGNTSKQYYMYTRLVL